LGPEDPLRDAAEQKTEKTGSENYFVMKAHKAAFSSALAVVA
jgi:hypothetical protein